MTKADFWPWDIDPSYQPRQRASSLNMAKKCPGFMFLGQAEGMRNRDTSTRDTSIGSIGHKWMELRIQFGERMANAYLDTVKEQLPEDFRTVLDRLFDWYNKGFRNLTGMENPEILAEEEMEIQAGPCKVTMHADLICLEGDSAVVFDWKFYNNPYALPRIREDLQMYAYGLGVIEAFPEVSKVTVYRVLCYDLRGECLYLSREKNLGEVRAAVDQIATEIWENRTTFKPGSPCGDCLLRRACPAYKSFETTIDATEIAPYQGGEISDETQVIAFLLAASQVEDRIKEGTKACMRWVEANGPVRDPGSGKAWGPVETLTDTIKDAVTATGELGGFVGDVDAALGILKTTKAGMEKVMKSKGLPAANRKKFFAGLRASGVMVKEKAIRWRWK